MNGSQLLTILQWNDVDSVEINLPTDFLDQFRGFLYREMDWIQLIDNSAHLFRLDIEEWTLSSHGKLKLFFSINSGVWD